MGKMHLGVNGANGGGGDPGQPVWARGDEHWAPAASQTHEAPLESYDPYRLVNEIDPKGAQINFIFGGGKRWEN